MQIIIEQGKEFNYKIGDVNENDIFISEYRQAALHLEEIVTATINYERINDRNELKAKESDYLNNIIAFTGERGQGKSSAMHSFSQDLLDNCSNSNVKYGDNTKKAKFRKLDTIDPSTFEDMHNVLEVVIARMFNDFEEAYNKDDDFKTKAKRLNILDSFQKVYEILSFLRNPKRLETLESDYEGSIQKIARMGDSTNLKKEMKKLVNSYLELFIKEAESRFLIIPIDDLDINIEYAYKISEQIRKYLVIPHVIIIMAVKIEQLKQCVEKEYRKQLEDLINAPNRLLRDEPVNMAAKYVEKLIPDGRKISLPEIRAISQGGKDAVNIIFKGQNFPNILDKYKSNEDGSNSLGIEKTLLAYIYDKTGIVFVKPENSVHSIVPNTMRELVNILSVLGKMDDYLNDGIADNKKKLQNIKLFEDYFMYTWVSTNLDDGHARIINELWHKSTFEKHQFICLRIMDKLEKPGAYTVDETWSKDNDNQKDKIKLLDITIKQLYKKFSDQNNNCLSYSVGDVVSLLDVLSARYIDQQVGNFVFAVKTLYTITMHRITYSKLETDDNISDETNDIYKFVGGDLWGDTKRNVIRGARGKFTYAISKILEKPFTLENEEELIKPIVFLTFFSNFPNVKRKYNEVIYENLLKSGNNNIKSSANFEIDNLFISPIDFNVLYLKIGFAGESSYTINEFKETIKGIKETIDYELLIKIAINYELNEHIKHYCIKTNDSKSLKETATNIDYVKHFISMVQISLKKIDYISYFKNDYNILSMTKIASQNGDESKLNDLESVFVKCLDNIMKNYSKKFRHIQNLRTKLTTLRKNIQDMNKIAYDDIYEIDETIQSDLDKLDTLCKEKYNANSNGTIDKDLQTKYNLLVDKINMLIDAEEEENGVSD